MENANILSQRNKEKFAHEGYIYTYETSNKDGTKEYWRCERRPGSVTVIFKQFLKNYNIRLSGQDPSLG